MLLLPGAWGVPLRGAAFARGRGLRALSPSCSLSPRSLNRQPLFVHPGRGCRLASMRAPSTGQRLTLVSVFPLVRFQRWVSVFTRFWLRKPLSVNSSQPVSAADFFLPSVAKSALQHPVGNIPCAIFPMPRREQTGSLPVDPGRLPEMGPPCEHPCSLQSSISIILSKSYKCRFD